MVVRKAEGNETDAGEMRDDSWTNAGIAWNTIHSQVTDDFGGMNAVRCGSFDVGQIVRKTPTPSSHRRY